MKSSRNFFRFNQIMRLVFILAISFIMNELIAKNNQKTNYMPGPETLETVQAKRTLPEAGGFQITRLISGAGLEQSPQINRLVRSAEETAARLETEVQHKISSLKQSAEDAIVQMKRNIEDKAVKLKQESEIEAQKIRQQAEKQTDVLFKQAAEQASAIAEKVEQKALQLKQDAAEKVISIINKAEEESLRLRKKSRERELLRRLSKDQPKGASNINARDTVTFDRYQAPLPAIAIAEPGKTPITYEWRQKMANEFNANSMLMKQIIMEGEDVEHLPDFLQKLKNQSRWFDHTLRGTQYVNDTKYRQIVSKQTRLRTIIRAQKKADRVLNDITKQLKLTDYEYKKIRLLSLYELNSFAQKELFKPHLEAEKEPQIKFTDQLIKYLVLRVTNEMTGRVKKIYPNFKMLKNKELIKLAAGAKLTDFETEVKKLRSMVDSAKQEKMLTKKQLHKKLEQQGKEMFEYQLSVKRLEGELERFRQQSEIDKIRLTNETQDRIKKELGLKLEEKEKEYLDLKLQLTGATQKIDFLDKQLKEAKDSLDRSKIELSMARDEAALSKKHVEDLRQEVEEQRKLKNLANEKVKLVEEVANRRIDEHVGSANKLLTAERLEMKKLENTLIEKEASLARAEKDLKEKKQKLIKKEQEADVQHKLFEEVRETLKATARIVSENTQRQILQAELQQTSRQNEKPQPIKAPSTTPTARPIGKTSEPTTAIKQPQTNPGMPIEAIEKEKRKELEKELATITQKTI